jgi:large subunit ribosomal protein L15
MKPHELKPPPGSHQRRKRVGRGDGSGRGKTAGRGTKGTNARGRLRASFEGGQMPLTRRIPKLKGFKPPARTVYGETNVGQLSALEGSEIGPEDLHAAGLVRKRDRLVKILGEGDIDRRVTVRAHAFSAAARQKIEAAGGSAEVIAGGGRGGAKR